MSDAYDLCLFGVTGFTGKLALDYLIAKQCRTEDDIALAVCARSATKANAILDAAYANAPSGAAGPKPAVCVADLVCEPGSAAYSTLESVVRKCRVVITAAGPFERYSKSLVRLCAENGVHYCDITGESDFFRQSIRQWDSKARETGATIVMHCGNDCIPYDCLLWEMNEVAKDRGMKLSDIKTYTEVPPTAAMSGGTLTTAIYQLSKERDRSAQVSFDPLLTNAKGEKSGCATKVTNPKGREYVEEFERSVGPWLMAPVMSNCIRRSNALLEYNESLAYGEGMLEQQSAAARWKAYGTTALVGLSMYVSAFQRFLPQPGEGPSAEDMDAGWLNVYARGKVCDASDRSKTKDISAKIAFPKDTGYLQTAHMLVESGFLMLGRNAAEEGGGVMTPAAAFKERCIPAMKKELGVTMEITIG